MKLNERKALLKKELQKYIDKSFFCPCLNAYVLVTKESIKETIYWASKSEKSTELAIHLHDVIKNAVLLHQNIKPKPGKQTKKFNFKEMFILKSTISVGTAKLTVGYKKSGKYIEYCITNFYKI